MSRLIPDSECVQSKCARNTTGCWGECEMRRSPAMYGLPTPGVFTVSAASPVQGAAINQLTVAVPGEFSSKGINVLQGSRIIAVVNDAKFRSREAAEEMAVRIAASLAATPAPEQEAAPSSQVHPDSALPFRRSE